MSHYYGKVHGQAKTTATRRGSKKSGIITIAKSWNTEISVQYWQINGVDTVHIELEDLRTGKRKNLFIGTEDLLIKKINRRK